MMCQRGPNEIALTIGAEKEDLHQKFVAYERGEIVLTEDELINMAVRMIMLKDAQ